MLGIQNAPDTARETSRSTPSWEKPGGTAMPEAAQRGPGTLTVSGVAAFLRHNGKKIASLALILFTAGLAIFSIIPTRYAATALVLVDPREQRVTSEQNVLPGIGQDVASLQSMIEIAKSDGFLNPLVEKLKVGDDYEIAGTESNPSKVRDKFRSRLDVSRRGLTYVIAFTFTSASPKQAARYANAVAEAFVANQANVRTGATEEAADWLNSRLKTLSDQLRVAEDAVAAFKAQHRIINAGKESTTRQLRVTELSQQVSAARLRAEESKTRYEQSQRDLKANVDSPAGARTELLNLLKAQRTQLNDLIAQKRAVFGDRHPDLVISNNQLVELNRQIDVERKRNIDSAKSDYETLRDQQKTLEQQLKAQEGEMLTDVQASVKLQELQRDADASRNIYEQFLSRFKTTNEQRLLQTAQAQIVSAATIPTRPTRPPLPLILVVIAIGAILSAIAIVALLDALGGKQAAGVDAPVAKPGSGEMKAAVGDEMMKRATSDDAPAAQEFTRIPDPEVESPQATAPVAAPAPEAQPDARGQLQQLIDTVSVTAGQCGKVILVTSGRANAGKTAIAQSLNTLAIERGMLCVLIQVTPDAAAAQSRPFAHAAPDCAPALRTSLRSLEALLGGGQDNAAPPDDVRAEFDLIVIDAPALEQQRDVASLSDYADFTVVVAGDGAVDVEIVRNTKPQWPEASRLAS